MTEISVVPYNPMWQKQFHFEATQIKNALGENSIQVHQAVLNIVR